MKSRRLSAFNLAVLTSVSVLILSGCSTVPETGRKQFNFMSSAEEMKLGLTEFDKMKQEVPVSKDPKLNAQLQRVGKRIAAVANLPDAQWEFVVFESKEANAFCLPGGKVGVYTGILPITKDDAGLATVIGHEVAHAVARHGGERISQATALQAVGKAVDSASAENKYAGVIQTAYGTGAKLAIELPFSRSQESEADHIGLIYMARAGYQPEESVAFWQRFSDYNKKAGGSETPWFLRTHPLDDTRIKQLQTWLPEAKQQYKAQ